MYRLFAAAFMVPLALGACTSPPRQINETYLDPATQSPIGRQTIGEFPQPNFRSDIGDTIFFDVDSSALTAEAQATLQRQATWLKTYAPPLRIEGHADERGTREYNLALGARRANAVRNYLIAQGIAADRLTTVSYGKERPAVLGDNEAAWSQNRRAISVPHS